MAANSRTQWILRVSALVVLPAANAFALDHDFSLAFSSQNQNMWGPGSNQIFNSSSDIINVGFSNSAHADTGTIHPHGDPVFIGGDVIIPSICVPFAGCTPEVRSPRIEIVPGWDLGKWGVGATASASGRLKLNLSTDLNVGNVSVDFPISAHLSAPDSVRPGELVTITSTYSVAPGASMVTSSPTGGRIGLALDGELNGSVIGNLCTGGCASTNLVPPINVNLHTQLFDVSATAGDPVVIGAGSPLSATFKVPVIQTTGVLNGNTLSSSGADTVFSVTGDVSKLVSDAIGIPLNGNLSVSAAGVGVNVGYQTIELTLGAGASIGQEFTFSATPMVNYALSNGDVFSAPLGEPISFIMPSGDVSITPTVTLDNQFTNDTRLNAFVTAALQALSAHAGIDVPGFLNIFGGQHLSFGVGPVIDQTFTAPLGGGIDLFNQSFAMGGFSPITLSAIQISAVPLPSSVMLMLVGACSMLGLGRRNGARV